MGPGIRTSIDTVNMIIQRFTGKSYFKIKVQTFHNQESLERLVVDPSVTNIPKYIIVLLLHTDQYSKRQNFSSDRMLVKTFYIAFPLIHFRWPKVAQC